MTEPELVAYLQQMEAAAATSTELATNQATALDRFYGRAYGNEEEGRSQAHTYDVRNLINWAMPGLMRVFAQSDELISIDGSDDQQIPADMATAMSQGLNHIYWHDNDGWANTYDFLFDGLVQRVGIIQVRWLPAEQLPPEEFQGIDQHGLLQLVQRGYKPISHGEPEQQPDGSIRLDVQVAKTKPARLEVRAVPPEEMTWEAGARSFDEAGYQRRVERVYIGDLTQTYPEFAEQLETASGASNNVAVSDAQQRWQSRHADQGSAAAQQVDGANRQNAKTTFLTHEFVRVDFDGDGIVELRDVRRVGSLVLHNEAVEASEYVLWSPVRVPHTVSGLSLADDALQTQLINTSLTRRGLDSLASNLNQRIAYDGSRASTTMLDELVDNKIGGLIKTNGPPSDVLWPLSVPDVSEKALAWKGHFGGQLEAQTGIGPSSNGISPESLAPNQSGVAANIANTAASGRLEMIARAAANGLQQVFRLMLRQSVAHQAAPRTIQQDDQPLVINPAQWPPNASVSIHVAMATANRQTQIMHLGMIKATQEQIMLKLGPNNPLCGMAEYATTLQQLVEAMGFRQGGRFFKKLPADFKMEVPPQEDPKVVQAKLQAQIDTEKMQAEQVRLDEAQRADLDRKSAVQAVELDLKRGQIAAELDMKRGQLAVELEMRREQLRAEAGMRAANGAGNYRPSPVRAGGMPG